MTITLTGNFKQAKDWKGVLHSFLKIGDSVCDEIKNHFINALPPVTNLSNLIQLGEPYFHMTGKAVFPTIAKIDGEWIYTGNCFKGETTNILMNYEMDQLKSGEVVVFAESGFLNSYKEYKGIYDAEKEVLFMTIPSNYEIIGFMQN